MFDLKKLHKDAIPAALEKAKHYRLLNEPRQAESICRDVLDIEPDNKQAHITLALAMTDQFATDTAKKAAEANKVLEHINDEYERCYYMGLVCERRATAYLDGSALGSGGWAYDWYRQAMEWYEKAEAVRPPQNDDALLRWNTCARAIMQNRLEPAHEPKVEHALE